MGTVTRCGRGWRGDRSRVCVLDLGHDGDCSPYRADRESPTLTKIFQGTPRLFLCKGSADVAQVAKWLKPGDTVNVPSGTVLPEGWMVPGVAYEVR